jgi:1-acyl-sn-glycerol-3-phosphate acyltransferase
MENIAQVGQRLVIFVMEILLRFFLHLEVKGKENLQYLSSNAIFALNHISELDGFKLPSALHFWSKRLPIYYVAFQHKEYEKLRTWRSKYLYQDFFLKFFGAHAVSLGERNYEKTLATHIQFLNEGKNVGLMPQGGISRGGNILEAKGGIIALVKATGKPVVPVTLTGDTDISMKDFFSRKKKVTVIFGKLISAEEILVGYEDAEPGQYAEIANERIMKKIYELY